MSIIGDIIGGIQGASAAGKAADTQVKGAQQAQQLLKENQGQAQDFQNDVWSGTQENFSPYQAAGKTSVNNLANLVNNPGTFQYGQTFQAPTIDQARGMPGYQFQLQTGVDALDKSAAARGNLFSGTQGTALEQYGQGLADTNYNNLYNQALQTYMTNYGVWNQGLQTRLGALQNLTNTGEGAAATEGSLGQSAANTMANIDLTGGAQQAQQINNAAAARASGYIGKANAYNDMIHGATSSLEGGLGNMYENGAPWWAAGF